MKQLSNLQFFLTIIIFGLPFQDLFGQGVPIKRSIFAQNAWVIAAPNYTNLNQYLPDVKLSRLILILFKRV